MTAQAKTKTLTFLPVGLQFITMLIAYFFLSQYNAAQSSESKQAVIMTFGSIQFWFGLSVIIMSTTVSLAIKLFANRDMTADESKGSNIAGLCSLGLMAAAWGGYDGVTYEVLTVAQAFIIFVISFCLFGLPILKQILYRIGIHWYLLSVFLMAVLVTLIQNLKKEK